VLPRLPLLCLLLRSSWLTVEGGRHRRRRPDASPGRTGSLAVSVSVGSWRSNPSSRRLVARLPSSRMDAVVSRRRRDGSSSSNPRVCEPSIRARVARAPPASRSGLHAGAGASPTPAAVAQAQQESSPRVALRSLKLQPLGRHALARLADRHAAAAGAILLRVGPVADGAPEERAPARAELEGGRWSSRGSCGRCKEWRAPLRRSFRSSRGDRRGSCQGRGSGLRSTS
jgi:hypothetical protein